MSMTFYYAPMSSATPVHWALEELGLSYQKVKLDLAAGDQKKPDYLKLNPNGKVPLLVVDGHPIFESLAQILYLGETYGVDKGLFPGPGLERAEAFKWLAWVSVSMHETLMRIIKNGERAPEAERNARARENAIVEIQDHLAILDAHLADKPFMLGRSFSLVDCATASAVPFLTTLGVGTAPYPNLLSWSGRCMTRGALARAMQG